MSETFISMKMICHFNKPKDWGLKFGETETTCPYEIEVPINKPFEKGIKHFLVEEMMKQVEEDPTRKVDEVVSGKSGLYPGDIHLIYVEKKI